MPLKTAAALAAGFREDSRIVMEIEGVKSRKAEILQAMTIDEINAFICLVAKIAGGHPKTPKAITDLITHGAKEEEQTAFLTPEDYMAAWKKIAEGD